MIVFEVSDLKFTCRKCGKVASPFFVPAKSRDNFWEELEQDQKIFCRDCLGPFDVNIQKISGADIIGYCFSEALKRQMN